MSTATDLALAEISDLAGLIAVRVGIWNDMGYAEPLPFEGAHPVPPLGQRNADNITGGRDAVEAIDELWRVLFRLREQLVGELRFDENIREGDRLH